MISGTGNRITQNSINANLGLGIDLNDDGVDTNDLAGSAGPADSDGGANGTQNYPVLNSATRNGTSITVGYDFNAAPGQDYTIEFFKSPACDSSGHGEGETYLGADSVTVGSGGLPTSFSSTISTPAAGTVVSGDSITATATDPAGNTSEFSTCAVAVRPRRAAARRRQYLRGRADRSGRRRAGEADGRPAVALLRRRGGARLRAGRLDPGGLDPGRLDSGRLDSGRLDSGRFDRAHRDAKSALIGRALDDSRSRRPRAGRPCSTGTPFAGLAAAERDARSGAREHHRDRSAQLGPGWLDQPHPEPARLAHTGGDRARFDTRRVDSGAARDR